MRRETKVVTAVCATVLAGALYWAGQERPMPQPTTANAARAEEQELRALIRGYRLRDDSPYRGRATDGTDPGVDTAALEAAIFGSPTPTPTLVPTPTPSCREFARRAWPRTWAERDRLMRDMAAQGWTLEVVTSSNAIFWRECGRGA